MDHMLADCRRFLKLPQRRPLLRCPVLRLSAFDLKSPQQVVGQNSRHQVQLVACKPSNRNVVHLALALQFPEDILLRSPAVMKTKYVPSRASFISHDHLKIIADLMRGEQIQLYRLLVLLSHLLAYEDEAKLPIPATG